jgi:hypothetical protein
MNITRSTRLALLLGLAAGLPACFHDHGHEHDAPARPAAAATAAAPAAAPAPAPAEEEPVGSVAAAPEELWSCPMHPEITATEAGRCSKCGMFLTRSDEDHDHEHGDDGHEHEHGDDAQEHEHGDDGHEHEHGDDAHDHEH